MHIVKRQWSCLSYFAINKTQILQATVTNLAAARVIRGIFRHQKKLRIEFILSVWEMN